MLDIAFEVGDIGTAPSNGSTNYYYLQIGSRVGPGSSLGHASLGSIARPNGGPTAAVGSVVGSVFTDKIQRLGGNSPANALSSGELSFTTNAIAGTTSHEVGHAVSLFHIDKNGSESPSDLPPIMGTGAIDLPNQDRINDREFSLTGMNSQRSGAIQEHIQQLETALGTVAAPTIGGITFELSNGALRVFGTANADRITFAESSGNLELIGNGESSFFAQGEVVSIHVAAFGGDDEVDNQTSLAMIARGGDGSDMIHGGSASDVLDGEMGDDRIHGRDGDNELIGRDGEDYLNGGAGNDLLYGDGGNDVLDGETGDDRVYGRDGDDELIGRDGGLEGGCSMAP